MAGRGEERYSVGHGTEVKMSGADDLLLVAWGTGKTKKRKQWDVQLTVGL